MNEELVQLLKDYVATVNSRKYSGWDEVNSRFADTQLSGVDKQLLKDYVATVNSRKYSGWDEVNARFQDHIKSVKKKDDAGESQPQYSEESGVQSQEGAGTAEEESSSQSVFGKVFDWVKSNLAYAGQTQAKVAQGMAPATVKSPQERVAEKKKEIERVAEKYPTQSQANPSEFYLKYNTDNGVSQSVLTKGGSVPASFDYLKLAEDEDAAYEEFKKEHTAYARFIDGFDPKEEDIKKSWESYKQLGDAGRNKFKNPTANSWVEEYQKIKGQLGQYDNQRTLEHLSRVRGFNNEVLSARWGKLKQDSKFIDALGTINGIKEELASEKWIAYPDTPEKKDAEAKALKQANDLETQYAEKISEYNSILALEERNKKFFNAALRYTPNAVSENIEARRRKQLIDEAYEKGSINVDPKSLALGPSPLNILGKGWMWDLETLSDKGVEIPTWMHQITVATRKAGANLAGYLLKTPQTVKNLALALPDAGGKDVGYNWTDRLADWADDQVKDNSAIGTLPESVVDLPDGQKFFAKNDFRKGLVEFKDRIDIRLKGEGGEVSGTIVKEDENGVEVDQYDGGKLYVPNEQIESSKREAGSDPDVDWSKFPAAGTRAILDMVTLIGGGAAIAKGAGAVVGAAGGALSESAAGTAGLFASSYLITAPEYYRSAVDAGLPNPESFAAASASITSALEMISPNKAVASALGRTSYEGFTRVFREALLSGKTTKGALSDAALFLGKEVGLENVQEITQGLADLGLEYTMNEAYDRDVFDVSRQRVIAEGIETVLLTTLATSTVSAPSAFRMSKAVVPYNDAVDMVARNKDKYMPVVEQMLSGNNADPVTANRIREDIQNRIQLLDKFKDKAGYWDHKNKAEMSKEEAEDAILNGKYNDIEIFNDPEMLKKKKFAEAWANRQQELGRASADKSTIDNLILRGGQLYVENIGGVPVNNYGRIVRDGDNVIFETYATDKQTGNKQKLKFKIGKHEDIGSKIGSEFGLRDLTDEQHVQAANDFIGRASRKLTGKYLKAFNAFIDDVVKLGGAKKDDNGDVKLNSGGARRLNFASELFEAAESEKLDVAIKRGIATEMTDNEIENASSNGPNRSMRVIGGLLKMIKKSASIIGKDAKFVVINDEEEATILARAMGNDVKVGNVANGWYDRDTNTAFFVSDKKTPIHEAVIHPLLDVISKVSPKSYKRFLDEISGLKNPKTGKSYLEEAIESEYDTDKQQMEAVTSFLTDVSSGRIFDRSIIKKFTDYLSRLINEHFGESVLAKSLGFNKKAEIKLDELTTAQDLAKAVANALATGQAITVSNEWKKGSGTVEENEDGSENKNETDISSKLRSVFDKTTDFGGKLSKPAVLSKYTEKNGIGYAEYTNTDNGVVDVYVAAFGANDYIGYIRVYDNGKPTNRFTSKLERRTDRSGATKEMIKELQNMLPKNHEYAEDISITMDGFRWFRSQIKNGYELLRDKNGNVVTTNVAIGSGVGTFEVLPIKNNKEFDKIKKSISEELKSLGIENPNIKWETREGVMTAVFDLPVLRKLDSATDGGGVDLSQQKRDTKRDGTAIVSADGKKIYGKGQSIKIKDLVTENHPTYAPLFNWWKDKRGGEIGIFGGRVDSEGIAIYRANDKSINLNVNHSKYSEVYSSQSNIDRIVAHEIIHGIIDDYIKGNEKEFNKFNDELTKLRDILAAQDRSKLDDYTNRMVDWIFKGSPEEMITYAFTDPAVARYFDSILVDGNKRESKTVWGRIKDLVLGIADKAVKNKTLLDAVHETLDNYTKDFTSQQQNLNERQRELQKPAGNRLFNEPLAAAKEIADRYYERVFGRKRPVFRGTKELDVERAKRIALAFDKLKHNPTDPAVAAAYEQMAKETIDQYNEIVSNGYKVEVNNEEPYANSQDAIDDLGVNKRLKIFSTESGFGDTPITDKQRAENPLLRRTGISDVNGVPLLVNDVFRFVHDFFGHAELGNSFGPKGEENAWNVHARMYSPLARTAMTTETRGQNSYVNFSGVNQKVDELREQARKLREEGKEDDAQKLVEQIYSMARFADQKVGLLPSEFSNVDENWEGDVDLSQQKRKTKKTQADLKSESDAFINRISNKFPEAVIPEVVKSKGRVLVDNNGFIKYAIQPYKLLDGAKKLVSNNVDEAVDILSERVVEDYNRNKNRPEIQSGIGWYSKMRDWFQKNFGANIEMFGQLLAATSAQTEVIQNFNNTVEAMRNYSRGMYDDLLNRYDEYVKGIESMSDEELFKKYDEWHEGGKTQKDFNKEKEEFRSLLINDFEEQPLKSNGKKFNANGRKVLQALYGNWLTQTRGPKTKNFAGNLTGRSLAPTIDLWAARYLRRKIYEGQQRWRIIPEQETGVQFNELVSGELSGDYPFAERVMQRAADKLGINADDLQAFLWYLEKDTWDKNGWTENKAAKRKASFEEGAATLQAERYQLGVSTVKDPTNYSKEDFENARKEIRSTIGALDGIIIQRVTASEGVYLGSSEPSFDVEFTVRRGTDVTPVLDKLVEIGKRFDQHSVLFTKVVDNTDDNSMPMIEIGLKKPSKKSPLINKIIDLFSQKGINGSTIARDKNGSILGIRAQFVPEYEDISGGEMALWAKYNDFVDAINSVRDQVRNDKDVSYVEKGFASSQVIFTNNAVQQGTPQESNSVRPVQGMEQEKAGSKQGNVQGTDYAQSGRAAGSVTEGTQQRRLGAPAQQVQGLGNTDLSQGVRRLAPNGKPSNLNEGQWNQVRTPEFKAWFGDWENDPENASKVLDANGEPMVMYHGTSGKFNHRTAEVEYRDISIFDSSKSGYNHSPFRNTYSFFTWNPQFADYFSSVIGGRGRTIYPVFLNVRNAIDSSNLTAEQEQYYLEQLKETGEDKRYEVSNVNLIDVVFLSPEGILKDLRNKRVNWESVETEAFDNLTDKFNKDGVVLFENNQWTLAVKNPNQIKSAIGNSGQFSTTDNRIDMSQQRRNTDSVQAQLLEPSGLDAVLSAVGMTEQERQAWKEENKKDLNRYRNANVQVALARYRAGEITQQEYINTVRGEMPIGKITNPKRPASFKEIVGAIAGDKIKSGIIGLTKFIPDGVLVSLRLDIPAYNSFDIWVPTIHEFNTGKVAGYASAAKIRNVRFGSNPNQAMKVAMGTGKSPFATMDGEFVNSTPDDLYFEAVDALNNPDWVQVGMNPERHSWFYDRANGNPILSADEVIQVGSLVMAKNPVMGNVNDEAFQTKERTPAGEPVYFSQKPRITDTSRRIAGVGDVSQAINSTLTGMYNANPNDPIFTSPTQSINDALNDWNGVDASDLYSRVSQYGGDKILNYIKDNRGAKNMSALLLIEVFKKASAANDDALALSAYNELNMIGSTAGQLLRQMRELQSIAINPNTPRSLRVSINRGIIRKVINAELDRSKTVLTANQRAELDNLIELYTISVVNEHEAGKQYAKTKKDPNASNKDISDARRLRNEADRKANERYGEIIVWTAGNIRTDTGRAAGNLLQGLLLTVGSHVSNFQSNVLGTIEVIPQMAGPAARSVLRAVGFNVNGAGLGESLAASYFAGRMFASRIVPSVREAFSNGGMRNRNIEKFELGRQVLPVTALRQLYRSSANTKVAGKLYKLITGKDITKYTSETLPKVLAKDKNGKVYEYTPVDIIAYKILEGTTGWVALNMFRGLYISDRISGDSARMFAAAKLMAENRWKDMGNGIQVQTPFNYDEVIDFMYNMTPDQADKVDRYAKIFLYSDNESLAAKGGQRLSSWLSRTADDLENEWGGDSPEIRRAASTLRFIGTTLIPYTTVPSNMAAHLLELAIPIVPAIGSVYYYRKGNNMVGDQMLGRSILGTLFYTVGMALLPFVTAGEDDDKNKDYLLKQELGGAKSFNKSKFMRWAYGGEDADEPRQVDDEVISLQRFGVFGTFLNYMAALKENLIDKGLWEDTFFMSLANAPIDVLTNALGSTARAAMDMSVFHQQSVMFNAIKESGNNRKNPMSKFITGQIETASNLVWPNQIVQATQAYEASTGEQPFIVRAENEKFVPLLKERLAKRNVPFIESPSTLYPVLNIWGRPVEITAGEVLDPNKTRYVKDDAVIEISRLMTNLNAKSPINISESTVKLRNGADGSEVDYPLDETDMLTLEWVAGNMREALVKDLIFNNQEYKGVADNQRYIAIQRSASRANTSAMRMFKSHLQKAIEQGSLTLDPITKRMEWNIDREDPEDIANRIRRAM